MSKNNKQSIKHETMKRHIILIMLFLCMLYPQSRAAELPSGQGAVYEAQAPSSKPAGSYAPFSSSNNMNRPLKSIDPGDTGDDLNNTGGTDDTGNVNDNNVPIADGTLVLILASVVYGIIRKNRVNKESK